MAQLQTRGGDRHQIYRRRLPVVKIGRLVRIDLLDPDHGTPPENAMSETSGSISLWSPGRMDTAGTRICGRRGPYFVVPISWFRVVANCGQIWLRWSLIGGQRHCTDWLPASSPALLA